MELDSAHALRDFQIVSKAYGLQVRERTAHHVKADFEGRAVVLTEDFAVKYTLDATQNDRLEILMQRDTTAHPPAAADIVPRVPATPPPLTTAPQYLTPF